MMGIFEKCDLDHILISSFRNDMLQGELTSLFSDGTNNIVQVFGRFF